MSDSDKTPILLHPNKRIELLRKGQDLFNDEQFFEAHEAWEELWHVENGRDKTFVQGLILVAGHFVHIRKSNWSGAKSLAENARQKFVTPAANRLYRELDITPIYAALDYNIGLLLRMKPADEPPPPEAFMTPKLF